MGRLLMYTTLGKHFRASGEIIVTLGLVSNPVGWVIVGGVTI